MKAEQDDDKAKVALIVVNRGSDAVAIDKISFEASSWVPSGSKSPLVSTTGATVDPFFFPKQADVGATRIAVTLRGLEQLRGEPVDGQLILYAPNNVVLGARAVSITPAPQPHANWPKVFFFGGLGVFVVLGLAALGAAAKHSSVKGIPAALKASAPGPDWTWDGWSAKLTAVGGLLAAVVGEITLPTVPQEIGKDTLIQLNLIFVVMLAVGPFIFYALRRRKVRETWNDKIRAEEMDKKGVWGVKGWLLVSYLITAVAVIGQLGALTLLGLEVVDDDPWAIVVGCIGALLAALACRSFWAVTYGQVTVDWDTKATADPDAQTEPLKVKDQPIRVKVEA